MVRSSRKYDIKLNPFHFSITLPEPPIEALFSACALGLLHKDAVLTELVIKELRKYEDDPKHGHHVVYLVSQFYWANVR